MRKELFAAFAFAFAFAYIAAALSFADELQPPLIPSTDVSADPAPSAGCALSAPSGPVVKAKLVVRNSLRNDVGPYSVTLPGYATDGIQDSYRPFLISARPGDTLRIDLVNQLDDPDPDNIVNLHTHGLIVAPRPYFPCNSLGDYIFNSVGPDLTQSGLPLKYRIDIPETLKGPEAVGAINGQALAKPQFPSGLYWFHSHVHGSAKNHVLAGQTGILAIDPKDDDATSAIRDASDHRFLVLRDIQLRVPQGMTPDKLASSAQPADWISGDKYDTQACRQASNPWTKVTTGLGYCSHPEVYTYDPSQPSVPPYDPNHDLAWLFTINGQMGPTITVDPGRRQVWRIANTTATVTYLLDLVDGSGAEQTLRLLTLDGVVAGTADSTAPGKIHPTVPVTRILLMPAARAEVVVNNSNESAADAVYTLRTLGFETGGANQPITRESRRSGRPALELRWRPVARDRPRQSRLQIRSEGGFDGRVPGSNVHAKRAGQTARSGDGVASAHGRTAWMRHQAQPRHPKAHHPRRSFGFVVVLDRQCGGR